MQYLKTATDKRILKIFDELVSLGFINIEKFEGAFAKTEMDILPFKKAYLRNLGARNFGVFAYFSGFNVKDNPSYEEYYKPIDSVEVPMLLAKREGNIEEFRRLQLIRKQFNFLFIPRGARKSTLLNKRAAWKYIRDILLIQQAPVILMLHGDKDRVQDNIYGVQTTLGNEVVAELYYDILETDVSNKSSIRFVDNESKIKHKEGHFISGSINTDLTGKHKTYAFIDDWVTGENCNTPDKNEKNKEAYYSLFSLDDHSGLFCYEHAGTMYEDDTIYQEIANDPEFKDITNIVCKPLHDDPYEEREPEDRHYFFPGIIQEEEERRMSLLKKKRPRKYYSQYFMIPYSREVDLKLVEGDSYKFAYLDDFHAPAHIERLSLVRSELLKNSGVVTSKDPSFSTTGKKMDDARSKDATITVAIKGGIYYTVDAELLLGGKTETLYEVVKRQCFKNGSSVFIIDAQGPQMTLCSTIQKWFSEDKQLRDVRVFPYKGASNMSSLGKAGRALLALSDLFSLGRIRVHFELSRLIAQIERVHKGFDFLDALIQVTSLNAEAVEHLGCNLDKWNGETDEYTYYEEPEYYDSITGY